MSPKSRVQKKTKRKKNQESSSSSSPSSFPILSLPEDILMQCIARVPKQNYRILSRVCKLFRSIVTSPDLLATRSLLKCTESCIYVSIEDCEGKYIRWYSIIRDNEKGNYELVLITSLPRMPSGGCVAFGSKIFVMGGYYYKELKLDVSIIDCRFDVVKSSSSGKMPELVCFPVVSDVVDGKIYVLGCYDESHKKKKSSRDRKKKTSKPEKKRMLKLDTEAETWEYDTSSVLEDNYLLSTSVAVAGKIYARGAKKCFVFDTKESKWEEIVAEDNDEESLHFIWRGENGCVIDEILYTCDIHNDCLRAYDLKRRLYCGVVKGVEGLAKYGFMVNAVVSCGDKKLMLLLHDGSTDDGYKTWCVEIALMHKNEKGEIWGNIDLCQVLYHGDELFEDGFFVTV